MDLYELKASQTFLVSLKALIVEEGKLLILKRVRADPRRAPWEWELPGGLLEFNEDIETGLRREVREETGLEVEIGGIAAAADHYIEEFTMDDGRVLSTHVVAIAYRCTQQGGDIRISDEHSGFRWVSREELLGLDIPPALRKGVESGLVFSGSP